MFYPICFLGAFPVVEAFQGTDKIACDTADAVEGLGFKLVSKLYKLAVHFDVDMQRFAAIFFSSAGDISINLRLLQNTACNVNCACHVQFLPEVIISHLL